MEKVRFGGSLLVPYHKQTTETEPEMEQVQSENEPLSPEKESDSELVLTPQPKADNPFRYRSKKRFTK